MLSKGLIDIWPKKHVKRLIQGLIRAVKFSIFNDTKLKRFPLL